MAVIFVAVFFWLTSRQYVTFDVRAPDLERFDQAIWNTLHGRFLYSTMKAGSLLGNHFSPFMALLSPLLLIWNDVRILMLAQTVGLAAAGLFLYRIVSEKDALIAPIFLLAFYLNPALHEVALLELRRITLAVPFLALAMYALAANRRRLMVVALVLALLCKEDVALIVMMVGLYLMVIARDWKWGGALALLGTAWLVATLLWVIPAFDTTVAADESNLEAYRQIHYFAAWGDSFPQILSNILRRPFEAVTWMLDREGMAALFRVFLPLGVVLPFMAPAWLVMALPSLGFMLLSSEPTMHRLEDWYLAPVLPLLFAAVAVALTKESRRQRRVLVAVLLLTTIVAFRLYSYAPLGGRFNPVRYQITDHHRLAAEVVNAVPPDASVAAQSALVTHLAHRREIHMYPLIPDEAEIDYYVVDRKLKSFPMTEIERAHAIDNLVADPSNVVVMEGDGIYLLQREGSHRPAFQVDQVADDSMLLNRVQVAVADHNDLYELDNAAPVTIRPGQTMRATLYWRALAQPKGERTVSVRIMSAEGQLLAQHDMLPSNGARPTSWWEPGWTFRDVYYLTLPQGTPPGPATLSILLYDTFTQEWIPFDTGEEVLPLVAVQIVE